MSPLLAIEKEMTKKENSTYYTLIVVCCWLSSTRNYKKKIYWKLLNNYDTNMQLLSLNNQQVFWFVFNMLRRQWNLQLLREYITFRSCLTISYFNLIWIFPYLNSFFRKLRKIPEVTITGIIQKNINEII